MLATSCFATSSSRESWLIDSGCKNHMTYDRELFLELDEFIFSKVKIENGVYIEVKGKGTVAIEGHIGLKLIFDVLYVPKISQNLLSVLSCSKKLIRCCLKKKNSMIKDSEGREVFNVKMKGKIFALDFVNKEQNTMHKEVSSTILWHKRLKHFHHGALVYEEEQSCKKLA